jgi:putative transferase (TIGR04331 family)
VSLQGIRGFAQERKHKVAWRTSAARFVLHGVNDILSKFSRNRDAFIIGSYLPLIEEVKLQIILGQCPQLWLTPELENMVLDPEKRRHFSIDAENYTGFERFVRMQLGEIIPICYIEGYDQLVQQVKSLPWPTEPRFIFTSVNFGADEIFRVWTGLKVEEGRPYFIGQHGNNYGTLLESQNWPELVTCDKFLTWGWTNGNSKNLPAFIFKTAGRKPQCRVSDGGLLLMGTFIPLLTQSFDVYVDHNTHQEEQFRFVAALPEAIQQQLSVRLRLHLDSFRWSDEQRWKDRRPNTRIEPGFVNFWKSIAQKRFVVFSYDSTGILETLSLNIPTICFWHGGLNHLLPSAKPYYELLRNAGILADSPEQAAENIAFHWNNVSEWWGSKKVMAAREAFRGQYARMEKHPLRVLKKLLTQNAKGA